jgi:HK97 family phage major capsid protein
VQGRDSKELRDITTGSTSGGFLIPLSFVPEITQTLLTYGPFASLVNTKYGAQPQKFPLSDDSARNFTVLGEGTGTSTLESDPTRSSVTINDTSTCVSTCKASLAIGEGCGILFRVLHG